MPNIWGEFASSGDFVVDRLKLRTGAFYSSNSYNRVDSDYAESHTYPAIGINASLCSWIYGNSVTVQPRSYVVYYIMKVKD